MGAVASLHDSCTRPFIVSIEIGDERVSIVDDVMKVLDKSAVWKRLQIIPAEVDDLKKRIEELEGKLGAKWPADVCRFCGEQSARLSRVFPTAGPTANVRESWKCEACGKYDDRYYRPSNR